MKLHISLNRNMQIISSEIAFSPPQIYRGGCVDSTNQSTAALFMALGQSDVSKLMTGELTSYSIHFLRHMKTFLQVTFMIEPLRETEDGDGEERRTGGEKLTLTCLGIGYKNLSKTHA